MEILGHSHVAFGVLAIALGLVVFCVNKGTQLHRVLGYFYVSSMLGLNITALMIYRLFGGFGPFHVLAVISLVILFGGWVQAYFKYPPDKWLRRHYEGMCWSYVGLLAATAAEIAVRLPFVQGAWAFGIATFVASFVVVFIGAFLLNRYRDRALAGVQSPRAGPNKALQPTGAAVSAPVESKALEAGPGG